jgi:uncharacterized damage-inducible protein DinB
MTRSFPEPGASSDVKALFLAYLDYFRQTVAAKVTGLSEADVRSSRLPSGWTPIELVKHLIFMERRWLVWGFQGEVVEDPWGDEQHGRWQVAIDESLADLLAALEEGGVRTRGIVEAAELSSLAALGGRFTDGTQRPSLGSILFHVLQEYARHVGHLDTARELLDGQVGE